MTTSPETKASGFFNKKRLLFFALFGVVFFIIAQSLKETWPKVEDMLFSIKWQNLALTLILLLIYRVINSCTWGFILKAFHQPISLFRASYIWVTNEILRWLPGSVWGFYGRFVRAKQYGVSEGAASLSVTVEILITLMGWGISGLIGLYFSDIALDAIQEVSFAKKITVIGLGIGFVGGLLVLARFFPDLKVSKKIRKHLNDIIELKKQKVSYLHLLAILVYYVLVCMFHGWTFWIILKSVGIEVSIMAAIGSYSIGWIVGFLAVGAPGGIGVREAATAGLLAFKVDFTSAVTAVILWRVVQIFEEVFSISVYMIFDKIQKKKQPTNEVA